MNGRTEGPTFDQSQASLWLQVAHDLRQPIQSLVLLTHLLSETTDASERKASARLMENLLIGLQDMLDLLSGLARIEAEISKPELAPCQISTLLAPVVDELSDLSAAAGIRLQVKLAPVTVHCHAEWLKQIVKGLVVNAIKWRTGKRVLLAMQRRGDEHQLRVTFVGPQIEASQHKLVFIEPPLQLGASLGQAVVAGLGLVARQSAAIGCRLEFASLSGNIQRVTVILPTSQSSHVLA